MSQHHEPRTFTVDVTRDGEFWMIRIPELDGVNGNAHGLTQALSEDTIEAQARDYAMTLLDIDQPTDITIIIRGEVGTES